ncbi:MAG TPA: SIMPL domain-containing protein [Ignavibacteriaceae bacterium]|nr:SIMPL domain-containing protein [Ignavibacteriaceae bacterium]
MKSLFPILFIIFFTSSYSQEKFINVNGTAELNLNADQIDFSVQIKVINESIEEAKKKNDLYVNQLLKILKDTGIGSNDIEVSPITLGKNYDYSERERVQKGFYAMVNVTFILKDLAKYYDLTDKLASNENFEVISSNYDISDYEVQNQKAYENALTAAKSKAQYMCNTLGLSLGDVLEIDETGNSQPYPIPFNTMSKETSQNENPFGKVTIKRTVRVKFATK